MPIVQNGEKHKRTRHSRSYLLVFASLSTLAIVIAAARPSSPTVLPLPHFDLSERRLLDEEEVKRARRVSDGQLPSSVRAIGEQLRRIGIKRYQRSVISRAEQANLHADAQGLLDAGQVELLLDLRALQSELFLREVEMSLVQNTVTTDLQELGGEFGHLLFVAWRDDDRSCKLSPAALRLMFRNHFNRLTGLSHAANFQYSLNDQRHYYSALLEHPPVAPDDQNGAALARLQYARALASSDPNFEARPLLGLLHLQLQQPGHALQLFDAFLTEKPHAPWSHIARIYRKAALALAARHTAGL